jgi:hypothetical protein
MLKPLTPEEVVQVSLATRGEGYAHRRWPEEVVKAFASAEVITAQQTQQGGAARRPRLFRRVLSLGHFSA